MLKRVFTSLLALLISYLGVIISNNVYVAILGKSLGFTIKLSFAGIDLTPKVNPFYNTGREIVLFALPSLVLLIISGIIYVVLQDQYRKNSFLRFFLFWLMMWCFLWPFSQLLAAPFTMINWENNVNYQGLAVIANWFLIPSWVVGMLGVFGIALVTWFGFMNAAGFLKYIYSTPDGGRNFWLQAMFYLPVTLSIPVCLLLNYPVISVPQLFLVALAMFFGIGMSLSVSFHKRASIEAGIDATYRSNFDLLFMLLLLVIYARFFMPTLC